MEEGIISQIERRALTQLLTDLNLFVLSMDLTMTKQDVLSISVDNPDRERQKLIREQNILKKVNFAMILSRTLCVLIPLSISILDSLFNTFSLMSIITCYFLGCVRVAETQELYAGIRRNFKSFGSKKFTFYDVFILVISQTNRF